jgi:PKD-like domain/Secretion system C-terminal sorting domain
VTTKKICPFTLNLTTDIDREYLLRVDGIDGDACAFVVTASPGFVDTPPLLPTLPIAGPTAMCPGGTATYTVPSVANAAQYAWNGPPGTLFNGIAPPVTLSDTTVQVTFPNSATGAVSICVQPFNSCGPGTTMCKNVLMQPIPPTVISTIKLCSDGAPFVLACGDTIWNPTTGLYTCTLPGSHGCDSTIRLFVLIQPPIFTFLPAIFLCSGGSIIVCGDTITQAGAYEHVCQSVNGCDSTVMFTIIINEPIARIVSANGAPIATSGEVCMDSSSITLVATASPGSYQWYSEVGIIGNGPVITVTQPGRYVLCVTQQFGATACSSCDTILVVAPVPLDPTGSMTAPATACRATDFVVSIDSVAHATGYEIRVSKPTYINGQFVTTKLVTQSPQWIISTEVSWTSDTLTVCVTPINACGRGDTVCTQIGMLQTEVLDFNQRLDCRDTFQYVCGHYNYEVAATHMHASTTGCDTIVRIQLVAHEIILAVVKDTICSGDSVTYCGVTYTLPGTYTHACLGYTGCDSIIYTIILKHAQSIALIENLQSQGGNDSLCLQQGAQLLTVAANGAFTWLDASGNVVASGTTFGPTTTGTYYLQNTLLHQNGSTCYAFDTVVVLSINEPLHIVQKVVDCNSLTAQLSVTNPAVGYTYAWYGPNQALFSTDTTIHVHTTGNYTLLITSPDGLCKTSISTTVNLSPAIQLTANWITLFIDQTEDCVAQTTDASASTVQVIATHQTTGVSYQKLSDATGRVLFALPQGVYNISVGSQPITNGMVCPLQLDIPDCFTGQTRFDSIFLRRVVSTQEPQKLAVHRLMLWPNPTAERLHISAEASFPFTYKILIFNALGQLVHEAPCSTVPCEIDVQHLPSGWYQCVVLGEYGVAEGRFYKE